MSFYLVIVTITTKKSPVPPSGLYYLYGSIVQSIRLRNIVRRGGRPENPARDCGEIYQMWTHPAYALHAGHVQQWNKGYRSVTDCMAASLSFLLLLLLLSSRQIVGS